jgi:hypothetical protein
LRTGSASHSLFKHLGASLGAKPPGRIVGYKSFIGRQDRKLERDPRPELLKTYRDQDDKCVREGSAELKIEIK